MDKLAGSTEILRQLGGQRFMVMTGAKDLLGGATPKVTLSMRLGAGARSKDGQTITHVRIELEPSDLYTVTFYFIRGTKTRRVVKSVVGVYNDNLRAVFTENTGFALSL